MKSSCEGCVSRELCKIDKVRKFLCGSDYKFWYDRSSEWSSDAVGIIEKAATRLRTLDSVQATKFGEEQGVKREDFQGLTLGGYKALILYRIQEDMRNKLSLDWPLGVLNTCKRIQERIGKTLGGEDTWPSLMAVSTDSTTGKRTGTRTSGRGIRACAEEGILAGLNFTRTKEKVDKEFPGNQFGIASFRWYRSKLKVAGIKVPEASD